MSNVHNLDSIVSGAGGDIPILGQTQATPVLRGLPISPTEVLTVDDLVKMDDREFKNLFLSVIISMMGGIYVPEEQIEQFKKEAAAAGVTVSDSPSGPGEDHDPED